MSQTQEPRDAPAQLPQAPYSLHSPAWLPIRALNLARSFVIHYDPLTPPVTGFTRPLPPPKADAQPLGPGYIHSNLQKPPADSLRAEQNDKHPSLVPFRSIATRLPMRAEAALITLSGSSQATFAVSAYIPEPPRSNGVTQSVSHLRMPG